MDYEIHQGKIFTELQSWHSESGSYLPPIEVLKRIVSSADDKGKATAVIDEGIRPLDGQFRMAASYSTNDDSATHDSAANTSAKQNP